MYKITYVYYIYIYVLAIIFSLLGLRRCRLRMNCELDDLVFRTSTLRLDSMSLTSTFPDSTSVPSLEGLGFRV